MANLLCGELSSWAEAYRELNSLSKNANTRVLEFGQISGGKIVLLAETETESQALETIENPHRDLLPGYFKLNTFRLETSLCVVEATSLPNLMKEVSALAHNYDFEILEIYRACNGYKKPWALLCNGKEPKSSSPDMEVSFIAEPSEGLKKFFNLS